MYRVMGYLLGCEISSAACFIKVNNKFYIFNLKFIADFDQLLVANVPVKLLYHSQKFSDISAKKSSKNFLTFSLNWIIGLVNYFEATGMGGSLRWHIFLLPNGGCWITSHPKHCGFCIDTKPWAVWRYFDMPNLAVFSKLPALVRLSKFSSW